MREWSARQGDAELAGVGEVREGLPAGRMLLPEDQLTIRSLGRPPLRDAPLQGAQMALTEAVGMPAPLLLQQAGRADMRNALEQPDEIGAPDLGERIGARPVLTRSPLARQDRVALDPSARSFADAGAGRRDRLAPSFLS